MTGHRHQILLYQCRARGKVTAWCAEDGTVGPYCLRTPGSFRLCLIDRRVLGLALCALRSPLTTIDWSGSIFASSAERIRVV
jgi:hypothetical protein